MSLRSDVARSTESSLVQVIPTGKSLGAEVCSVDLRSFDDWAFASFMRALLKHQVLLVRGQRLSERDIAAFSRRFGHADLHYTSPGTMIGDRLSFCSLYAAYDALSPVLRSRVAHLKVRHLATETADDGRRTILAGPVHPLVGLHADTGRSMLALGQRRHSYVVGLEHSESDALLDDLWQLAERPEFGWAHTCRAGDLVVWDTRCTIHRHVPPDMPTLRHSPPLWNAMPTA
ncbi:TauD/TfdA dioxygenase family protein [Bradyrhizobium oligotrophicum]|uniref:TauD/TfdA dioxygenase family protein n=1 Tax=Bradyrhizobium oligotrophicum TaxID=44255 RepID=UPI003EB8BAF0